MGICFLKIPDNSTLFPRPSLVCHLVDISCPNWVPACPEAVLSDGYCWCQIQINKSFLFFFCTWQGFTLFPRATVKSIAAETNNWKITFINSGKRMFELSGIAEKLGCASAGTVSTFACVGPVYKCNTDIRLTGLLTFSRVGDSGRFVEKNSKLLRLQLYFVTLLRIWKTSHLSTAAGGC